MKLYLKVSLIVFAVCLALSIVTALAMGGDETGMFFVILGTIMLIVASICLVVGLVMLIADSPDYGKAFLLSAAIIFLVGTGLCGVTLTAVNM